jgi:hypothetical protein
VIAVNLVDAPTRVELPEGTVLAATQSDRVGTRLAGSVELGRWEGMIARTSGA